MKKIRSYDNFFSAEEKEQIIKDYVEKKLSIREICRKYNIGSSEWVRKLLKSKIRNLSEANKIARKKYPEKYKHTDESKEKIRKAHLKWMKEHPEQTAWRLRNMSYPEKCFKKMLEDNGLDKKYLIYREYSIFPYFIDFAFINEKLAVEIDGSQHLEEDRKRKDEEKDKLLAFKGWRILRIAATEVTHNSSKVLNVVAGMLGDSEIRYEKVGILKAPRKKYIKVTRGEDGLTDKQREQAFNNRKVKERPTKEELFEMVKNKPFRTIAKDYNVSDAAISKWCKEYGLPYRKKDIDKITGKEHKYSKELHICLQCSKEYYTDHHNSRFCCDKCYKEYIKKNGLINKENRKRSFNWIHKSGKNGSFVNKRVGDNEVENYILQGWIRGRKL